MSANGAIEFIGEQLFINSPNTLFITSDVVQFDIQVTSTSDIHIVAFLISMESKLVEHLFSNLYIESLVLLLGGSISCQTPPCVIEINSSTTSILQNTTFESVLFSTSTLVITTGTLLSINSLDTSTVAIITTNLDSNSLLQIDSVTNIPSMVNMVLMYTGDFNSDTTLVKSNQNITLMELFYKDSGSLITDCSKFQDHIVVFDNEAILDEFELKVLADTNPPIAINNTCTSYCETTDCTCCVDLDELFEDNVGCAELSVDPSCMATTNSTSLCYNGLQSDNDELPFTEVCFFSVSSPIGFSTGNITFNFFVIPTSTSSITPSNSPTSSSTRTPAPSASASASISIVEAPSLSASPIISTSASPSQTISNSESSTSTISNSPNPSLILVPPVEIPVSSSTSKSNSPSKAITPSSIQNQCSNVNCENNNIDVSLGDYYQSPDPIILISDDGTVLGEIFIPPSIAPGGQVIISFDDNNNDDNIGSTIVDINIFDIFSNSITNFEEDIEICFTQSNLDNNVSISI